MRLNPSRAVVFAAITALSQAAPADIFNDDFESYDIGTLPGGQWHDIFERAVDRPVPSPSITVIDTTDAHGNPTKAVQSSATKGTNGGFVAIEHAKTHTISMDVRIDRIPAANQGWPMAVGFIQNNNPAIDVNGNPQALIYGWNQRRWRFFISQGSDRPAADFAMAGPQYTLGVWYRLTVTVDTELGIFEATVADAATGQIRNTLNHAFANWDPQRGMYDALTMFDGETANSTTVGQASVDNVNYVPAPVSAAPLAAIALLSARRRR